MSAEEEREDALFDESARRYAKLDEFTRKLELEREQREFELAAERYLRFREFTLELEALEELQIEQRFNESVELYLRKQEFTRRLLDQRRAAGVPDVPAAR